MAQRNRHKRRLHDLEQELILIPNLLEQAAKHLTHLDKRLRELPDEIDMAKMLVDFHSKGKTVNMTKKKLAALRKQIAATKKRIMELMREGDL